VIDNRQDKTPACCPIEHDGEINEAARHRNVGDVHRPDLVRPCDLHAAEQIRIDLVAGSGFVVRGRPVECFYPHPPHQRLYMPAADLAPLQSQQAAQHTRTGEGILQMQSVETPHDREIDVRHRARQVIDAAPADVQSLCLPGDRQFVLTVNHRFALSIPPW